MSILSFFRKRGHKRAIMAALSDTQFEFRTFQTLVNIVGGDSTYASSLVNSLPTRRAYRKPELVGLTERVGVAPRKRCEIGRASAPVAAESGTFNVTTAYVPSPREKLVALLSNPKFRFRTYNAMIDVTGLGTANLDILLREIGARRAVKAGREVFDTWGLISRVGPGPNARPVAPVVNPKVAKLVELLSNPSYEYRKFDTLIDELRIGEHELTMLLEEVEARPMVRNGKDTNLWGLVSRVGPGPNADPEDDDDESDDYFSDDFDDE